MFNLPIIIMFNASYMYTNYTALLFLGEVELKDQQAKTNTVDQQLQAGETVHQQGAHYSAATYYIIGYVLDSMYI